MTSRRLTLDAKWFKQLFLCDSRVTAEFDGWWISLRPRLTDEVTFPPATPRSLTDVGFHSDPIENISKHHILRRPAAALHTGFSKTLVG